jgi:CheY-like chemotaxis protein
MCIILIVEDNAVFRNSLKDTLCRRFPSLCVHEAVDGMEALQKVNATIPDLIFMDICLPGTNGLELTKTIKSSNQDIVIAVFTSYDLPEYRDAAFRCGANYFLTKGTTTSEEIMSLVESVLPVTPTANASKPGINGSMV